MNDVLTEFSVMTDFELDKANKMMQHKNKCKAFSRDQGNTDLSISKAILLRKRL